jgi:1,4-alpha-glucan branching enzyme
LETITCAPPRIENGKVLFSFQGDRATSVSLAGDFNDWDSNRTKLDKDKHGFWRTALDAPAPGVYQYKFIVNGEWWLEDPNNGVTAPDGQGGLNSVLTIR